MHRVYSLLFVLTVCLSCFAITYEPNGSYTDKVVIVSGAGTKHPHLCEPAVIYHSLTSTITVDFGAQPVNSFVVTISSLYTDVDYYATSSFTTIPLAPDGFSDYSIVITTAAGDVFEGTLTASDYTTSEMY